MKITATIITLNEERNIARAIESLRCSDEILIVDSGSVDRTVELARETGRARGGGRMARLRRAEKLGRRTGRARLDSFAGCGRSAQRSARGRNLESQKGRPEVRRLHHAAPGALSRAWILHSGWYPDRKVRLYHRDKAKWVGDFVHESVHVDGRVGHLESNLLHFTCESIAEHVKTMDRYTTLAAQELAARKLRVPLTAHDRRSGLDFREDRTSCSAASWTALEGLIIAYMAAFYTFLKYSKARIMS